MTGHTVIDDELSIGRHRKRMPIILVAATELNSEMEAQARKVGVKKWVTKTPDMSALCAAIRDMVED